ncbi:MAG: hypothetical protein LAN18_12600 [Acidobacteriia bacterium]|nr:hypothetical protein [Terriglobia bacterium]
MKLLKTVRALAVALVLCVTAIRAQDQKQDPRSVTPASPIPPIYSGGSNGFGKAPVPAARGVSSAYDPGPYDLAQVEPDTNTLSGAELFGVGSLQHSRNVFDPAVSFSQLGQSGQIYTAGQSRLQAVTIFGGSLNFNRIWSRYHFTATYDGGENLYHGPTPNRSFHNLVIAQEIDWERWRLHLRDDFAVSPLALFGGAGMGGPGLIGQFSSTFADALHNIGQRFVLADTIQTGQVMRYMNTVLGEAEYSFSRRSAFSFAGSYGILHFPGTGYISSRSINAQTGYDYLLDPKDSIAVLASYGKIDYTGTSISTGDYGVALAFGRKITGRLAFQAAAGPEQIRGTGLASGNFQMWTGLVNSALTYERRRSGFSLGFARGLTNGSGVLFGALSNTFRGSLHHQFTRFWSGSVNGGYAFNRNLVPVGTATASFNTWFIGANLVRQLGRHAWISFNYGLLKQYNPVVCPVASCGVTGFQQTGGMTVNWHLRAVE